MSDPDTDLEYAEPLDLTPSDRAVVPGSSRTRRGWVIAVIVVLVVVFGYLVYKGLGDATLYFYNADEAVAERASLGDDRFRLQGTVEKDTVEDTGDGVSFVVTYNGAEVAVDHTGDPPELFQEEIPVVVEGRWAGDRFASDRIIVKHSEAYVDADEYDERTREAETGGSTAPEAP